MHVGIGVVIYPISNPVGKIQGDLCKLIQGDLCKLIQGVYPRNVSGLYQIHGLLLTGE